MQDRLHASLVRLFNEQDLVFWYNPDQNQNRREAFEDFALDGVEKVEITNNEFGLKHRILRRGPKQRFLIYKEGPEPPLADNWLLDLQLASAVFVADVVAICCAELGLPKQQETVVREHSEFFNNKDRVEALGKRISDQRCDTPTRLRLALLAVCVRAEGGLDTVIEGLLGKLAEDCDAAIKGVLRLIDRCGLTEFFWQQVEQDYGYASPEPNVEDFALTLFQSCYHRTLGKDGALNAEATHLFNRWKNNVSSRGAFKALAQRYQGPLGIGVDVEAREVRALRDADHFEEIDRRIIRALVQAAAAQTVSPTEVRDTVRARRNSPWYPTYKDIYQAISLATQFQQALAEADLTLTSPEDGVRRYVESWYRLDQLYRKFIYHYQKSDPAQLLGALFERVENHYTSNYLLSVNDAWQDQIAGLAQWTVPGFARQVDFYRNQAADFRRRNQKVAVIVSDALRYEVGDQACRAIRKEDRFEADLKPMISILPSSTQFGMAALLPNKDLTLLADGSLSSFGLPTQGTQGREKILGLGRNEDRAKALNAKTFLDLSSDEGKALFRDHDILYLYHNRIDSIGDKRDTEEQVAQAVEDAVDDLIKLVRKLTSANFSNILITADHGFLYQHRALGESDFSLADPTGSEILDKTRRFILGRNLGEPAGMKKFSCADLGLAGDFDVLLANSINRLRVKGAGSRFVHGGASLQEIIVPVIQVSKRRETDVSQVDVQIIVSGKSLISSGQITVTLYQNQPVSEKQQPRTVRAGIYAADGTLISDEHELTFDYSSDNSRERERPVTFLLSRQAEAFNNQEVFLRLQEQVGKTSHYQNYASHCFQLHRVFATDLDF